MQVHFCGFIVPHLNNKSLVRICRVTHKLEVLCHASLCACYSVVVLYYSIGHVAFVYSIDTYYIIHMAYVFKWYINVHA